MPANPEQANESQVDSELAHRRSRFAGGRIFGAVFLIVLGIAVFLDNIGILRFQEIWKFWPVYLLGVGIAKVSAGRSPQDRSWGILLVVSGILFLGWNLGIFHLRGSVFNWFIGLMLVSIGVNSLVGVLYPGSAWGPGIWASGSGRRRRGWLPDEQGAGIADSEPILSSMAIFGSAKRRVESQAFRGGDAQAIFGEVKFDLRLASIAPGTTAVIDVQSIFGAVKLKVPYGWRISLQVQGVFGAGEDKTVPDPRAAGAGPLLVITGTYLFGAVEVEN
jgi:hypothetical protein